MSPATSSADHLNALFASTFGGEPDVVASAPGRVNLIGEHTDYSGGQVLPIAIVHRTTVAMRAAPGSSRSRAVSQSFDAVGDWSPASPVASGGWWDYVSGVTRDFIDRGIAIPPLEIAISSDVPTGAGLSSSAAIEVATSVALAHLIGTSLSLRDAALLSHRVENAFVGVASGMMDQFASALAERDRALHLDCETAEFEHVPMREAVLIFDTAIPRSLRHSAYNRRRAECADALARLRRLDPQLRALAAATPELIRSADLPSPLEKRALHVSEETRRVERTVAALHETGAIPGALLYESHESLRVQYECSTPELDWFVHRAMSAPGVHGARLTGAGWGGCAIAVGEPGALEDFAATITGEYANRFGLAPRTWITRADQGARVDSRIA